MKKGKRKIVQAATSGKKERDAQKPKEPPPDNSPLTYQESIFVQHYLDTNSATEAYVRVFGCKRTTANSHGPSWLSKPHIIEAIESKRKELEDLLGISRQKMLAIKAGILLATMDDFHELRKSPGNIEAYANLGYKKYALKTIKIGEFGNEIVLMDKGEAWDELWKKLGYEKGPDSKSGQNVLERVFARIDKISRG